MGSPGALWDVVNKQMVRILLECILVSIIVLTQNQWNLKSSIFRDFSEIKFAIGIC